MIVDVLALIDDAPLTLRRPLLPVSESAWRLPLFVDYGRRRIPEWPAEPWFCESPARVNALLVVGRRFGEAKNGGGAPPPEGYFSTTEDDEGALLAIGLSPGDLWPYRNIEIVAASQSMFSAFGTKEDDGTPNPPMLLSVSNPSQRADALRYQAISFERINMRFIRDAQSIRLYGGWAFLELLFAERPGAGTLRHPMGKHVLREIAYDAEIGAIDFRYKLNAKHPTEVFSRLPTETHEANDFLEDEYEGKIRPRAIGHCDGVPAVPLNSKQVFTAFPAMLDWHDFQLPPGWLELAKVEAEISGPLNGIECNGWIEIWPTTSCFPGGT